jgi:group I intron endonuclease
MEKFGFIYYIHCKETNKGYVGQTILRDPLLRFNEHWSERNRKKSALHCCMNKFGKNAFTIQILSKVNFDALPRLEEYWAEQLETYIWDNPGGYNMVLCGGNGTRGYKHTEKTKIKMSNNKQNYSWSQEQHIKFTEYQKNNWKKILASVKIAAEATRGIPKSDAFKEKVSQSQLNRYQNPKERIKASKMATERATDEYRSMMSKARTGIVAIPGKLGEMYIQLRGQKFRVRKTKFMPSKTFLTLEDAKTYRDSFLTQLQNGTPS